MNFGNHITEILAAQTAAQVGPKGKPIVVMPLLKMGGKEKKKKVAKIWGGIKKKNAMSTIFLQHFHNKSQVTSYY